MPSLDVVIKNDRSEYGRPVYIKIIGENIQSDISKLSLDALNNQFAIDTMDVDREKVRIANEIDEQRNTPEIIRQILSLKLYPRQTGELEIPSFRIGKVSSRNKKLVIEDPGTNGSKITLAWQLSSSKVWQRQPIIVSITMTTPEQFATIKLQENNVNGFDLVPLTASREWAENISGGESTITAGWSLLPLKTGRLKINLPAIEYHLNGVVRRVFYLPVIEAIVRPLPTYLPPTIPVGKVQIRSSLSPKGILETNDLAYWNLSVESETQTPFWLPPVLRQIKSDDTTQFYPATSERGLHPNSQGVNGRVDHVIPFKPLVNGFTNLPILKIQYFDPVTGRLESITHEADRSFSISTAARILVTLFICTIILYLFWLLLTLIYNNLQYRKLYQHAIEKIRNAENFQDIRSGLRLVARAESWSENLSLSEWAKHWKKKYQCSLQFDETMKSISCAYYGNDNKQKEVNNIDNKNTVGDIAESLQRILRSERMTNRQVR